MAVGSGLPGEPAAFVSGNAGLTPFGKSHTIVRLNFRRQKFLSGLTKIERRKNEPDGKGECRRSAGPAPSEIG
jgi:hypothetical protein